MEDAMRFLFFGILKKMASNLEMASSFAFSLGTGFRFNVSRLIALTLGVDYTTAKFKWDIGDQSMGTLGIKGGFAFRLK